MSQTFYCILLSILATFCFSTSVRALVSITQNCTAVDPSPADVPSNTTDESRPIVWSQCKQEEVKDTDTWYNYSKPLHAFDDEALRHVTLRRALQLEYLHMRLGVQASFLGVIAMSSVKVAKDTGSYFRIELYNHATYIYGRSIAGVFPLLHHVQTGGIVLSASQPAAVLLTVSGDTLQLRHEYNSAPFLEYKDERFRDINYFGFTSVHNHEHKMKFYYDC